MRRRLFCLTVLLAVSLCMSASAAGIGITFIPNECVEHHPGVQYVPLKNWHQALYMCILYDKWLEPPVWGFVESLVKVLRSMYQQNPSL